MEKIREPIVGYVGPMFAAKTLWMLHLIQCADATGRKTLVFKPDIDTRYPSDEIRSRAGGQHSAISIPVNHPEVIYRIIQKHPIKLNLVAFDEIQFFSPRVVKVVLELAQSNISVAFCGLNRNYRGEPFSPTMEKLLPLASELTIVKAKCMYSTNGDRFLCGADAEMTQRLVNGQPDSYNSPTVIIEQPGAEITYQARCLEHWQVRDMPQSRRLKPTR